MTQKTSTASKEKCHHCGQGLPLNFPTIGNLKFCCEGCETVFKILQEQDLCEYYNLESNSGNSPKELNPERFQYLSDFEIQTKLLAYKDEKVALVNFHIPQMHCASCIWLLEKLYRINPAVLNSRVNFSTKELYVRFNPQELELSSLVFLLASLGYEPQLNLSSDGSPKPMAIDRKLWIQIAIAGFSFGNIMLLSVPGYFDFLDQLPQNFKNNFGLISFLLSLPVFFYSDLDYFKSALGGIRNRSFNLDVPLSMGMLSLFFYSCFEVFSRSGMGYFDSFAGLVFFLLIGKAFQQKTIHSISFDRDFKSFFPIYATKIFNEEMSTLPLEKLKIGDRILVRRGNLVPADGYLLRGEGMIDYSFVTGESIPEAKELGEIIHAGGKQIGQNIEVELIKTVSTSYLTQLWNNSDPTENRSFSKLNDIAGKYFTLIVIGLALIGFFLWLPSTGMALKVFSSVLIIACPCALALSGPFSFGNGMRLLAGQGFYIKNTGVLEALSNIDHIMFDKTGTLTKHDQLETRYNGIPLNQRELAQVKSLSAQSGHPLSKAIYQSLDSNEIIVNNFQEIQGKGIKAEIFGDVVIMGNSLWVNANDNRSGVFVKINDKILGRFEIDGILRENIQEIVQKLAPNYQLSICSGDSKASWEQWANFMPMGSIIKFESDPLEKAIEIQKLKRQNKKVCMIGDGLNDGLAFKSSDVGLAFTEKTGEFSPASDGVISAEAFRKLDRIFAFSRDCSTIVKVSFGISILYNGIGLYFALLGTLTPVMAAILMPLSSISVVIFATSFTKLFFGVRGLGKNI